MLKSIEDLSSLSLCRNKIYTGKLIRNIFNKLEHICKRILESELLLSPETEQQPPEMLITGREPTIIIVCWPCASIFENNNIHLPQHTRKALSEAAWASAGTEIQFQINYLISQSNFCLFACMNSFWDFFFFLTQVYLKLTSARNQRTKIFTNTAGSAQLRLRVHYLLSLNYSC